MGDFSLPSKEDLQEAFEEHANGDDTIDIEQFKQMCYMLYLSPTDRGIQKLFEEIDVNKDDRLSLDEVSLLIERQWTPFEERKSSFLNDLRRCRQGSGPITRNELKQILQRGSEERLSDEDVNYVFKKLDLNNDKLITEEEITECIFRYESRGHAQEVDASEYQPVETQDLENDEEAQEEQANETEDKQEESGDIQEETGDIQGETDDIQEDVQEETGENEEEEEKGQENGENEEQVNDECENQVDDDDQTNQETENAGETEETTEQTEEQTEETNENEQDNGKDDENETENVETEEQTEQEGENEQTEEQKETVEEQTNEKDGTGE